MKHLLILFSIAFVFAGCTPLEQPNITTEDMVMHTETASIESDHTIIGNEADDLSSTPLIEVDISREFASELTLSYINHTEHSLLYGLHYTLQYLDSGEWITIDNPTPLHDVAYIVESMSSFTQAIDLTVYGDLAQGHYRIVKQLDEDRMDAATGHLSTERLQIHASAEFEIS